MLLGVVATLVLLGPAAPAQVVTGPDWIVCYSLPTQTTNASLNGEFAIRDTLLAKLDRLQEGHSAQLATFTLSGNSMTTGAAAPILSAVSRALDRGASIHFVADSIIKRSREFLPGLSLNSLARRRNNPMALSVSPSSILMHNKLGLFEFGPHDQWVFLGSGNFTGAANMNQWNIATVMRNSELFDAVSTEMAEFRARRFGQHKRTDHDRATFRLEDAWGDCWVRFGPYPHGTRTAKADIRQLLNSAQDEIYFAMHRFNRHSLRRALVAAANRGVKVVGVIPLSDRGRGPLAISRQTARFLANPNHYTGTNRVELLPARVSAIGTDWDSGQQDLVHTKYVIIDPHGERPVVVHGPANWTASGLSAADGNDETTLFLRHAGLARAFLGHFQRMTGTP